MTIAKEIEHTLAKSSWIRKMFEEGAKLKSVHGAQNVFDFSLGNPNLKPPKKFLETLKGLLGDAQGIDHAYMPNTGYPFVRQAVAAYLNKEQNTELSQDEVIMTCGAAGALNVILKAILDPGDLSGTVFRRIQFLCRQPRRYGKSRKDP
jgi:aspartate aminotransferase